MRLRFVSGALRFRFPPGDLFLENLPYPLNRIRLLRRLIGPQARDPGKRSAYPLSCRSELHHVVECYFQHNLWFDYAPETLIFNRVLQKPFRHLCNLGVGQS